MRGSRTRGAPEPEVVEPVGPSNIAEFIDDSLHGKAVVLILARLPVRESVKIRR